MESKGFNTYVKEKYGFICIQSAADLAKVKKPFEQIQFRNEKYKGSTYSLQEVWDNCVLHGIQTDVDICDWISNVTDGKYDTVDSPDTFWKLLKVQKERAAKTASSNARNQADNTTPYMQNKAKISFSSVKLDLNFSAGQSKVHNFCNKLDEQFFKAFVRDENNVYYVNEQLNAKLLLKSFEGKIVIDAVDPQILTSINDKIFAAKNDLSKILTQFKELDFVKDTNGIMNYTPIEDIFTGNKAPFFLLQFVDIVEKWKHDEEGNGTWVGIDVALKKDKAFERQNVANLFVNYMFNNFVDFKRYIVEQDTEFIHSFSNNKKEIALSHFEKPEVKKLNLSEPELRDYIYERIPDSWGNFFDGKMNEQCLFRVLYFVGLLCDANNEASQYLCISDEAKTGKSFFIEMLEKYFRENAYKGFVGHLKSADVASRFGLAGAKVWEHRLIIIDEYDGKALQTGPGKSLTANDKMTAEIKNGPQINFSSSRIKLIVPTNEKPRLTTFADRRRCLPVSFKINYEYGKEFTAEQKNKLYEDMNDFVDVCFTYYSNTPMVSNDGSYKCMCPSDYEDWLEGKLKFTNEKDIVLRAFSKDDWLKDWYLAGDYSETEESILFSRIYETYFEHADGESVSTKNMIDVLQDNFEKDEDIKDSFEYDRQTNKLKYNHSERWSHWKSFLKTQYNITTSSARVDGKPTSVYRNIKIKER